MDVVRWQVSVVRNSGNSDFQPGLKLAVALGCRVCSTEVVVWSAKTLTPNMVKRGEPMNPAGYPDSWLDFVVHKRLAMRRECVECGILSVIPQAQRQPLVQLADGEVSAEWLREAVAVLDLGIRTIPETQDYYARDVYHSRGDGSEAVELDWHDLQSATLPA